MRRPLGAATVPPEPTEHGTWTGAEAYDRFMGRWSRQVAAEFVEALKVPAHAKWLDVGCGVGSLTAVIVERAAPSLVVGVDPSAAFLRLAGTRVRPPAARFEKGPAEHLSFDDATFDATVSGLVLNFLPDPHAGLREGMRVTRPGGVVAAYVWDYAHLDFFLARLWQAVAETDGRPAPVDERHRWRICSREGLSELAQQSGLRDWKVWTIPVTTSYASAQQVWERFLLGAGPAGAWVSAIPPERLERLRQHFLAALPLGNGRVLLTSTAIAVAGSRP